MSKYFGDRQFYKKVIAMVLPIVIQLIFVFTLCIFGAQFFGFGSRRLLDLP